jgi:hypothetical protein
LERRGRTREVPETTFSPLHICLVSSRPIRGIRRRPRKVGAGANEAARPWSVTDSGKMRALENMEVPGWTGLGDLTFPVCAVAPRLPRAARRPMCVRFLPWNLPAPRCWAQT